MRFAVVAVALVGCKASAPAAPDGPICHGYALGVPVNHAADLNAGPPQLVDLDGDHRLDIIYRSGTSVVVQLQGSDGTLGAPIRSLLFDDLLPWPAFVLGDLDRDGDTDLVASISATTVRLATGDGHGGFVTVGDHDATAGVLNRNLVSLTLADVDQDHDLDLLAVLRDANGGGYVSVSLGDVRAGLGAAVLTSAGDHASAVEVADMTGDGLVDLVIASAGRNSPGGAHAGGSVDVWAGAGDGSFAPAIPIGPSATALAIGDLDDDGTLDVATNRIGNPFQAPTELDVLFGTPTGLPELVSYPASSIVGEVSPLVDLDGDGVLDVVLCVAGGQLSILINTGGRTFATQDYAAFGDGPPAVGDLTGDLVPDVAFSNGSEIVVFPGTCGP